MISYGDESLEQFLGKLRSEVPRAAVKGNEKVKDLPEIFEFKPSIRERSLLLNPQEAQKDLKKQIIASETRDAFLDVVSAVREERVEIVRVSEGAVKPGREFILEARNPNTGVNVDDFRVLLGVPERKGQDCLNEVTQAAFYKVLNLQAYRSRAYLN